MRLKPWLNKAFGLARDVSRLAPSTIAARRRALERTIDDIITTPTSCDLTTKLRNRFARAREQLLTFADWPGRSSRPTTPASATFAPPLSSARSPTATAPRGRPWAKPTSEPSSPPRASPPAPTPSGPSQLPSAPETRSDHGVGNYRAIMLSRLYATKPR